MAPINRRTLLRGAVAATGAAVAAPFLSACRSGGESASSATSTMATNGPRLGGIARAAATGNSAESLDPHSSFGIGSFRAHNLYDKLTNYAPDGATLEMRLAKTVEPNADGTEWRIVLREGIEFHNGKTLDADDVLYSFARILDPKVGSPGAPEIAMIDLGRSRRVSERELVVVLNEPIADFAPRLAWWNMQIVPAGTTSFDPPIGTGPFRYKAFTPGRSSVFTRNENYWRDGDGPYLDELEIVSVEDPAARSNGLMSGEFDVIGDVPYTTASTADENRMRLIVSPGMNMYAFTMNCTAPPFDDVRVRQALRFAVDRQELVDKVLLGFGVPMNDLFGPGLDGYPEDLAQRPHDPERAKALLREAGYERVRSVITTSDAGPGMVESATLLAEQVRAGGFDLEVRMHPPDTYWSEYINFPLAQTWWWPKPIESFVTQALLTESSWNETSWRRADFDELARRARGEMDPERRRALYRDLQQLLFDEGGYIFWGAGAGIDATTPSMRGVEPHRAAPFSGYEATQWWIA